MIQIYETGVELKFVMFCIYFKILPFNHWGFSKIEKAQIVYLHFWKYAAYSSLFFTKFL